MLALGLLGVIVFEFSGGSPGKLATDLATYLKHPAVILLDEPRKLKRFVIKEEDAKYFEVNVFKWSGCFGYGAGGFGPKGWPLYMKDFPVLDRSYEAFSITRLALTKERDLWVVPPQGEQTHFVTDLTKQAFSKKVNLNWTMERAVVAISAGKFKEDEILEAAATAIGAKLVTSPAAFNLEFDPKQFRARQVAYYERLLAKIEPKLPTNYAYADLRFKIEAFKAASDEQLVLSATQRKRISLQVKPGTALMKATIDRAMAYADRTDIANAPRTGPGSPKSIVDMVDFDRPLTADMSLGKDIVSMSGKIKGEKNAGITF